MKPQFPATTLSLCFLISSLVGSGSHDPAYLPDNVSIRCGSRRTYIAPDSREWVGDSDFKFSSLLQIKGSSSTTSDPTARISHVQFSYTFLLKQGQKLIRLHFNPFLYRKKSHDLFSVEAESFLLLDRFSPSVFANALGVKSFVKEFCVSLADNQKLEIVFSPENDRLSTETYAFINGIEIISVPLHLSYFGSEIKVIGQNSMVYIDKTTALEVVHRLHTVRDSSEHDVFGMWGENEDKAGKEINGMTWNLSVDAGFSYLVRLHFSNTGIKIAEISNLNFTVLINGMFATSKADLFKEMGDNGIVPRYGDHMAMIKGSKQQGMRNLSITLLSDSELANEYGTLKGFEIFKLSNAVNSLVGPNLKPQVRHQPTKVHGSLILVIGEKNALSTVAITIVILVNIVVQYLGKIREANPRVKERKPSARAARLCRRFSLADIRAATKDFSKELILGKGGFGIVYKGAINGGREIVAIKRLKRGSNQGELEFWTEIETLSELRHVNLVTLIGYCCERQEMILVYEYISGGTLEDRLYKLDANSRNRLSWKQRLRICIGAGRGLDYVHTGYGLIHRDVKSPNILLDENLTAKIADFGMAKLVNIFDELQTHVSTIGKGTFGYLDPDYYITGKLTNKSDVYSFGAVLLEVLCGKPILDHEAEEDQRSLIMWAREVKAEGDIYQLVDPCLRNEISTENLKSFLEIVEKCLQSQPKKRPAMAQVVLDLMSVLEVADPRPSNNVEVPIHNDSAASTSSSIQQNSISAVNAPHPPVPKHNKRYKAALTWPWNAIWNRVKHFKRQYRYVADPKPSGYLAENPAAAPNDFDKPWKLLFSDIVAATNNFSSENKIGIGSNGTVYKGIMHDGREIAVKKSGTDPQVRNFLSLETDFLWQIPHHMNLCKLIGFCQNGDENLLVSEYISNRSLFDHLHGSCNMGMNSSVINSWKMRIKISLGAAQGIDYLHRGQIIHGNVKSSNILLDENWTARVSDIRLSCDGVDSEIFSNPMGGVECMDPEYHYMEYMTLTEKSDVYSLGVVLVELLTGKEEVFSGDDGRFMPLVEDWKSALHDGNLLDILDSEVGARTDSETRAVELMAGCAARCLRFRGKDRPSMEEVVSDLGKALAVCEDVDGNGNI